MNIKIPVYMSAEEYSALIHDAMTDHLKQTYGTHSDSHIVDLTAAASAFMDSVFHFVSNIKTVRETSNDSIIEELETFIFGEKYKNKGCDPQYDEGLDAVMNKIRSIYNEQRK